MNVSRWLARRRMAALTKAVYDSALSEDDEPAEPSVARFLPGGASVAALIVVGDQATDVVVYVSGAVASPGVLTLPASSRVIDAITAAGGALPEADLESINLARILVDGEQIRVGVAGESPPPSSPEGNTSAGACVRLNTATETELQTLPGIGPALAKRIVTYRSTHPRLTSVDELDDVPGIGPSLIEKIRPGVCG